VRRWWVIIALLLSLGVNLGLVAAVATRRIAARPDGPRAEGSRPRDMGGEPLPRFRRLADRLGLEGEQRRRFLDLQRQLFEETVRIRMRQAESQREVRRELVSREPDRERIDALLQQSARDFLTLEQALAKNIAATRAILSPDQEEEYLRIVSRMRPPGPGGFGPQQQPPRRRLPPMRERRFPRERREFPEEFEEEGPPL
jgi:Spy/CpxP family protein refolding chaperone